MQQRFPVPLSWEMLWKNESLQQKEQQSRAEHNGTTCYSSSSAMGSGFEMQVLSCEGGFRTGIRGKCTQDFCLLGPLRGMIGSESFISQPRANWKLQQNTHIPAELRKCLNQNREIMTLQQEEIFFSKILGRGEYWVLKIDKAKVSVLRAKYIHVFLSS